MKKYKLAEEIIKLSQADTWDEAEWEWSLDIIYEADEPETCLCGHHPIKEIWVLKNLHNNNPAVVGNCCVKMFMGLPSDLIFQAAKRVRKDKRNSLNTEAIQHAYDRGWIDDWQRGFYLNIMRKRNLTQPQLNKKIQVNEKVLNNMRMK